MFNHFNTNLQERKKRSEVSMQAPSSVLTRRVEFQHAGILHLDPKATPSINFSNSAQGHAATCTLSHATWIKAHLVAAISHTQWLSGCSEISINNVIRTAKHHEQQKKISAPSDSIPLPISIIRNSVATVSVVIKAIQATSQTQPV